MSSLKGDLIVTIHRCVDLKDVKLVGTQDPYVTVEVGKTKYNTRVHTDGGRSPVFNQSFLLPVTYTDDTLHIRVKHKGTLSDDSIGRADVKLVELLKTGTGSYIHWIQLVDVENFAKQTGKVVISIDFNGTGAPTVNNDSAASTSSTSASTSTPLTSPQQQQQQQQQQPLPSSAPVYTQQAVSAQPPQQAQVIYTAPLSQAPVVVSTAPPPAQAIYTQAPNFPSTFIAPQPTYVSPPLAVPTPIPTAVAMTSPVASAPSLGPGSVIKDNRLHVHPVRWQNMVYSNGEYGCDLCNTSGNAVSGGVMHCEVCCWDAHPQCVQARFAPSSTQYAQADQQGYFPPPQLQQQQPQQPQYLPPQHSQSLPVQVLDRRHPHALQLLPSIYAGIYNCDACNMQGQGQVYHCQCGFDIHPHCLSRAC